MKHWPGIIILLLFIGVGVWIWREASVFLQTPPSEKGEAVSFDVPQGATFTRIANDLAARGLITDAGKFRLLAWFKNQDNRLQAGRFALNNGWLPGQILDELVNGKPILHRVTVPEGLAWWQTGKLLEEAGLVRFDDFREVINDPEFLRHYGIPFASAEGFLMPDTYLLKKPDLPMPSHSATAGDEEALEEWRKQARSVAGRMVDNFWRKTQSIWPDANAGKDGGAGKIIRPPVEELRRWLILASIVERETGIPAERSRVAGVYANRLKKGMLLQADPTVIYGLGQDFSGRLRRVQLDDPENPYNTYQRPGLPPGPICSMGVAAIKAAINPEKHDYIYFVAKIDDLGGHTFSRTLEEHNRAVGEYRRQKSK